ncbi:MAG: abortive phage infection protein [Sphingobacteriales bacterium]|nr:MAG: abortive phage infection protein [Sphingobacteriales bacterium]
MEIDEFLKYRNDLLTEAEDEEGFLSEESLLHAVLPLMLDAKLIDTEDYNESYFLFRDDKIKINGYSVNESGERLQLYLVNEESIENLPAEKLKISQKAYYENLFARAVRFVQNAVKGQLDDELQDADGSRALVTHLSSDEGIDQYDVLEVFLISATATVENRGATPQPKKIDFEKEKLKVTFHRNRERITKEILIVKHLIDLNFLHSVLVSQGNREPLTVDFDNLFGQKIEAIKAADEKFFESYLCVLPGRVISDLYKEFSTRLLEKNVRSFLQFPKRGVNSGIRDTIKWDPEKFIAYNNGLTITATGKEIAEENGRYYIRSLTDFQIVNGGQTTATIYFTQKDGVPVDNIRVMAKINIVKHASEAELDDLISNISTYSNAQSRVSKVDLKARSLPMVKLKALSDSVVTPRGLKWFFERAKGELSTMIRKSGRKESILKRYPKERRFTKEELAKYYTAWGNTPYKVKKGGEKVFREFIEEITGEAKMKPPVINRVFFENVIARIILFRGMEKIYAEKKIGNLRAAVIPYSISVLYNLTDGSDTNRIFDLTRIWQQEGLEEDLSDYLCELMRQMNELIKKYATSDDPSENSKTKELWERIWESEEIDAFKKASNTAKIIRKFTISVEEYRKKLAKSFKTPEVNFQLLQDNVFVHSNGMAFYQNLLKLFTGFRHTDRERMESIIDTVYKHKDLNSEQLEHEQQIIHKVMQNTPELFDRLSGQAENFLHAALDLIISTYNKAVHDDEDIMKAFQKISKKAQQENIEDAAIWTKIGEKLAKGAAPVMADIYAAISLFMGETAREVKQKQTIDEAFILKMVEWDSKKKILSANERQYLADFAYGFKKLNAFHENNVRKHLHKIAQAGFQNL